MNQIVKLLPNLNTERLLKLGQNCLDIGCCTSCTLRYLGVRSAEIHRNLNRFPFQISPKQESNQGHEFRAKNGISVKEEEIEQEVAVPKVENVCPACLGILQIDLNALAKKGFELFKENDYKLKEQTFNISLRLPVQLIIRHQSMLHNLYEQDEVEELPKAAEVKEVFKYLIRDEFAKISSLTFDTTSPFAFTVYLCHQDSEGDYEFLNKIPEAKFQAKKSRKRGKIYYQGASGDKVTRAMTMITKQHFMDHHQMPPPKVETIPEIEELFFNHTQLYVAGRYCKLKRHISNSKWIIGGKKLTEDSVEELIGHFLIDSFRSASYKFSSSGREDSDVLMLGRGRPFYFEIQNPRNAIMTVEDMKLLQDKINSQVDGKISVQDLQICTREDTSALKDSASTKSKSYQCIVELEEPVSVEALNELSQRKNIELKQRNPNRVPRRADLIRDKMIEWIKITPENTKEGKASLLKVDMKTSAGTYVKEFVHGDGGRTEPCMVSLLDCKSAKCLQLDVLEVFLDWPPRLE